MQDMAKTIQQLSHRKNPYQVFADFVEMSAIAISNAVDKAQFDKREQRYFDIIKGYSRPELNEFPKLLGMLTMHLEQGKGDVLGGLFHELELHNQHAGQYFTPYHLCQMMASFTVGDGLKEKIDAKGYVTVNEPTCGSGAMVIAVAEAMQTKGYNYQQTLHATMTDIDSRCVHMAYVQASLLHLPAVVVHGNTLTLEEHGHWFTPAHILGGWSMRLHNQHKHGQFLTAIKDVLDLGKPAANDNQADLPLAPAAAKPETATLAPIQEKQNYKQGQQLKLF